MTIPARLSQRLLATVAAVCVAGVASAEPFQPPADTFSGRWFDSQRNLTLDVSRCGKAWCGIEVTNGTVCGKVVARLEHDQDPDVKVLKGKLQLTAATQQYTVVAFTSQRGAGTTVLIMHGTTGATIELWRRTFPFQAEFVASGAPKCRPGPNVS
jgi:hypothetical protein